MGNLSRFAQFQDSGGFLRIWQNHAQDPLTLNAKRQTRRSAFPEFHVR